MSLNLSSKLFLDAAYGASASSLATLHHLSVQRVHVLIKRASRRISMTVVEASQDPIRAALKLRPNGIAPKPNTPEAFYHDELR